MIAAASPQTTQDDAIAIGLMCKPPRPGITKTRLAATVGAVLAAELSESFLRDVARLIAALEASHRVRSFGLYTPADAAAEIRALLPASFRLAPQQGGDFCAVVHSAVASLLKQHPAGAILINADSPTLPSAILAEAVSALRPAGERLVISPACDGGYYLIGLKTAYWPLFRDMPWSTPDVCRLTIARARQIGLPVVQLPVWYDVDDASSLAALLDEIAGAPPSLDDFRNSSSGHKANDYPPAPAPATRALLQARPAIDLRRNIMTEARDGRPTANPESRNFRR